MSILETLLQRKIHVTKVVDETKTRQQDLERERRDAKGTLRELEQERDKLASTIFDEKAKVLLAEDRAPIEREIERLKARQPQVDAEITELAQEIIPRLAQALTEAEQAVKAEALTLRRQAAIRAAEGREALLRQWNVSTADLLRVTENIGRFNGRFEFHERGYRSAAEAQRQPTQPTGEAIPATMLQALHVALGEAWQRAYRAGEEEASANDITL